MKRIVRAITSAAIVGLLAFTMFTFAVPHEAIAGKGGGKGGGGEKCCDPALEPGTGNIPFCFEGHSCCSDGKWRCNNPDATPSCPPGNVCEN